MQSLAPMVEGERSGMKIASPFLHQNCIGNWRAPKVIAAYGVSKMKQAKRGALPVFGWKKS